jgi:hypothetical protein
LQKQTILLAVNAHESSCLHVNARMPAHIVSCNTQRRNSQQNFVVGHRHHLHHPTSHLFLFVPVQALPHVHMHFVTLSLFFFLLLAFCRLGHSCVFLQFMPERKLAPATKLTVFLSLGPHFRLDDGRR